MLVNSHCEYYCGYLEEEEASLMDELAGPSAKWKETLSRRVQARFLLNFTTMNRLVIRT